MDDHELLAALSGQSPNGIYPPPPPFPVEVLPPAMRAYVEAGAGALPAPLEMIAAPMLAMVGALIGNRAHLAVKASWHEYPTLYIMVVAEPGQLKTPALGIAFWPIRVLQEDAQDRQRAERAVWEAELERWKGLPTKERGNKPVAPKMRDYFTNDATMEKLAVMLEGAPGILLHCDELVGWVERMDQYRKGGDQKHYLSIWSGNPLKVDRKTEGASTFVRRPVLGVVGGIQPEVVPALGGANSLRDGFIDRILPLVPDLTVKRFNDNDIESARFADIMALYRAIDFALPLCEDGEGLGIHLSRGARSAFAAWADETNALAAELKGVLGGYYTKLEAHCLRFALILHILHNATDPRPMVAESTMHHAIEVAEWFRRQIDLFVPMLGSGLVAAGRSAGLWSRIRNQLEKGRCRCVDDPQHPEKECGWVYHNVLQRGLWKVTTEELTIELDSQHELGVVEKRRIQSTTRPGWEWRLTPQNKNKELTSAHLHIVTSPRKPDPWEV